MHVGQHLAGTGIGADLSRMLTQVPAIVWVLRGPEHVVAFANSRAQASVGDPPQTLGRPLAELVPPAMREALRSLLDSVYASGEPVSVESAPVDGPPGADPAYFSYVVAPTRDASDAVDGLMVHAFDVSEQVEGRRAADALAGENARLHREAQGALGAAARAEGLYRALYEENPSMYFTLDADATVLSVNRFGAEQLGHRVEDLVGRSMLEVIVEEDHAAASAHVAACLSRMGVTHEWELRKRRRDGSELWVSERARAVASSAGPVVLIVCEDISERRATEQGRLALLASEHAARRAAERAHARLAVLHRVTAELSGALAADEVAEVVLSVAAPALRADMAVLLTVEDGARLRVRGATGVPEDRLAPFDGLPLEAPLAITEVVRTRTAISCATLEEWRRRYPEGLARIAEGVGARSFVAVPLHAREPLGCLALLFHQEGAVPDEDRGMMLTIGEQCAQALERARLYERERRIARNLQESLLPRRLPRMPGLAVASRYAAAGEGIDVGGDFFDAFESQGGWGLVVGDVCGKGPEAAGLTGLVRHSLRAVAPERSPSEVMAALNRTVLGEDVDRRFCTLVFGRVDPPAADGAARLVLARAGHPPALLREPGGAVRRLQPAGALLGVVDAACYEEWSGTLVPGATLVLYTDGVTEARGAGGELFGIERLETCLAGCADVGADEIASRIESAVAHFQSGPARDDIALLVVQSRPGQSPAP